MSNPIHIAKRRQHVVKKDKKYSDVRTMRAKVYDKILAKIAKSEKTAHKMSINSNSSAYDTATSTKCETKNNDDSDCCSDDASVKSNSTSTVLCYDSDDYLTSSYMVKSAETDLDDSDCEVQETRKFTKMLDLDFDQLDSKLKQKKMFRRSYDSNDLVTSIKFHVEHKPYNDQNMPVLSIHDPTNDVEVKS